MPAPTTPTDLMQPVNLEASPMRMSKSWMVQAAAGVAAATLLVGLLGLWLVARIERTFIDLHVAATASLFSERLAPFLKAAGTLSADADAIQGLVNKPLPGHEIVTVKVWDDKGRIVHSNRRWLVGRVFPVSEELQNAWQGRANGELGALGADENESERPIGVPIIEVYAPVRSPDDNRIVAVAEFYEKADGLSSDLRRLQYEVWALLAVLLLALSGAVVAAVRGHHGKAST